MDPQPSGSETVCTGTSAEPRRRARRGWAPLLISAVLILLVGGSIATGMLQGSQGPGAAAYARGMEAYAAKDWRRAGKELREAVKNDPEHVSAWANLAMVQLANGDVAAAEASSRQALRLLEQGKTGPLERLTARQLSAYAHGNLAVILSVQRRFAEGAREARTALSLDPANPRAESWKRLSGLEGIQQ